MAEVKAYAEVATKVGKAVEGNALFTAYEIAQELKADNPEFPYDKREVREIIKGFLGRGLLGNYARTQVAFAIPTDCGELVFVYHPADVNPTEYPHAVKAEAKNICPHCGGEL
jgi:hypothetical protein